MKGYKRSLPTFAGAVRGICSGILDLVYPPHCLVCGQDGLDYLCQTCIDKIDLVGRLFCRKCSLPCESYHCRECREREYEFEYACSAGIFDGVLREAIHRLKYKSQILLADPLGEIMVRCYADTMLAGKFDLVVPIPIHSSRTAERGFNQAVELAERLCARLSLRFEPDVLAKPRPTRHQVDLPYEERLVNMRGAFRVRDGGKVAGKRVLLVDDVFTTGSTLNEAASTLKAAGAREVYGYTLARSL